MFNSTKIEFFKYREGERKSLFLSWRNNYFQSQRSNLGSFYLKKSVQTMQQIYSIDITICQADFLTLRAEELWREGKKKFFSKKNKFWYMKHHFQFARQILKTNDQLIFGSKSMKARHNTNSWKISLWHKKKNFYRKILPAVDMNICIIWILKW